ncbi:hypothetical protein [Granulicella aggregans]|uniref:hypothetical protein n=1 Tax=Granulicella aggregans TaxID=474949 RepID=UPI0021E0D08D|nr:hypothetical protein [Granulicella aggregans]
MPEGSGGRQIDRPDFEVKHMTSSMTDLVSEDRGHGLSGLSLTQLEVTLVAANLLLDAWRTTRLTDFERSIESSRLRGSSYDGGN